jgi:YaiO family outer membrane protein
VQARVQLLLQAMRLRTGGASGVSVLALLLCPYFAQAQEAPRFRAELNGSLHALTEPYGQWKAADFRLMYRSPRFTPMLSVATQTRPEGSQQAFGLASYVVLSERVYTTIGFSSAPFGETILFPRARFDLGLFVSFPALPGWVLNGGVTQVKFRDSNAQMASLGAIYYGPSILMGGLRVSRDGVSGVLSLAGSLGFQDGAEGKAWYGAGVGGGREAYQLLAATPFDVRFTSVGGYAFVQKWVTRTTGLTGRYEFERKLTAYTRHGFSLGYFVDF